MQKADKILRQVEHLQNGHEISIVGISEPISSAVSIDNNNIRTSDVSSSSLDSPTPASLEADLEHYKELFAKLRFSYVEQVTKEKFIRAIVGDPPLIVTSQENIDLEKRNAAAKAELKALKQEVADMVVELEAKGRELSRRHERVQLETASLRELPGKAAALEAQTKRLRAEQAPDQGPLMSLPLARTLEMVDNKKGRMRDIDRQLEQLQGQVPRKRKELERLQAELQTLEVKRQNCTAAAKEAKRRKQAALGGVEDDLEERGRWLRATEVLLRQVLDVRG